MDQAGQPPVGTRGKSDPVLVSWRGYWISSDPEEIAAYLQEQGSRARTQAKNDEPARRLLARLRGEKIIRVRSYIRRAKAESTPDGQEKWEV